jgi:hypothetical protein
LHSISEKHRKEIRKVLGDQSKPGEHYFYVDDARKILVLQLPKSHPSSVNQKAWAIIKEDELG